MKIVSKLRTREAIVSTYDMCDEQEDEHGMMADADLLLRAFKMSVDAEECPYNCGHVCPEDFERCLPDDNKVRDCWVDFWLKKAVVGWTTSLQDENVRLEDDLAKHKPDERVGECWCSAGYGSGPKCFTSSGWVISGAHKVPYDGDYCWDCGALLMSNGIARRNADAARMQRVREALDNYSPDAIRERWMSLCGFVPQSVQDVLPAICQTADAIRAALDQEVGNGE